MVGNKRLPESIKSNWTLVGNSAAVLHGTTRLSDNLDLLIDDTGQQYRNTEQALIKRGWEPIFVDDLRTKHHPHFVVRSWYNNTEKIPKNGRLCRRLNLIVPVSRDEAILLAQPTTQTPSNKRWSMCSLSVLFAMKASLARPLDIADMVEIIQGGAKINWWLVRQLLVKAHLDGVADIGSDDVIDRLQIMSERIA
jgi:hypothetical protein